MPFISKLAFILLKNFGKSYVIITEERDTCVLRGTIALSKSATSNTSVIVGVIIASVVVKAANVSHLKTKI